MIGSVRTMALGFVFLTATAVAAQAVAPPGGNGRITHARDRSRPPLCNVLPNVHQGEIWQGLFLGRRPGTSPNILRRVGGKFCFPSLMECQSWLYDMDSMNEGPIRASECRRIR